jgi:membrane protease YdiL (CAAX protease family)
MMNKQLPTPGSAALLFVAASVLMFTLGWTLFRFSPEMGLVLVEPLAILAPTLILVRRLGLDFRKTLRFEWPTWTDLLLAFPLAFSLTVLNEQLAYLTTDIWPLDPELLEGMAQLYQTEGLYDWIIKISSIGIGAAVSEEIMFRGFIQKGFEQGLPRSTAIFTTALLFALMHAIPQGMPGYVLAGVVLGIVALGTGSILVPIVIHLVFNVSALLLYNLAEIESLGAPVWIPAGILIPALLIFIITMGYFVRKMAVVPEPTPPPRPRPTPTEREGSPLSWQNFEPPPTVTVSPERRRLGWFVIGCSVAMGSVIVLGLFFFSLYQTNTQEVHASYIETLKLEILKDLPPADAQRSEVEDAFETLTGFNETEGIGFMQLARLNWLYVQATTDGGLSPAEVDAIITEIESITGKAHRL